MTRWEMGVGSDFGSRALRRCATPPHPPWKQSERRRPPPPQIAYGKKNPNWILPARYYNADVKSAKTSIRFHVAHTSCFVKKVLR